MDPEYVAELKKKSLLNDKSTSLYVEREATGRAAKFFKDFKASMKEMSLIGVLTGTDGEIRKNCAVVN
ncbi:hypothetical protein Nepgr_014435 [Nepenthes gracilis]|uniref:Plant heme peroxidase family profile domain-containing protein n=1 Tax=Nepenthes gracilis TaxID=150966 RepID=A0AAD3SKV6_NEPGR|nr:hypothetical protein Nepgr_014435 [Nepenthes gracilis]